MQTPTKKLYRSRKDRIISGVCAGLGDFFNMDPTVVRVIFVLGMILGFGSFAFIYLVMIFVVPEEPEVSP